MKDILKTHIIKAIQTLGSSNISPEIDYPEDVSHGDFSTNIAMVMSRELKLSPKVLAEKIIGLIKDDVAEYVESISVAGPGFINFKIKDKHFLENISHILDTKKQHKNTGAKIMVEYTDPNPFKIFHIGHLMANAIGESLSRLAEYSGNKVVRACYQGDVGLHVAKTIWAITNKSLLTTEEVDKKYKTVTEKVQWLGDMYVEGSRHEDDPKIMKEIALLNKKIFEKTDSSINKIYDIGRKWSLEYFDLVYARLGSSFDKFFFESEVADQGLAIVNEFLGKNVFAKSDGAIVFHGEGHGLHTRVFITSNGLPTYETKELGLTSEKFRLYPDLTQSIVVTANEQDDYFKVLLKVLSIIKPEIAMKTKHLSHGIIRFKSGKMSSRKGNIISAHELIESVKSLVLEKMHGREFDAAEVTSISEIISIAAIKYSILRQSIGGDVIFDSAKSISFEGDSGPYLQYSAVRANSVLEKSRVQGFDETTSSKTPVIAGELEKLLYRFDDIAMRASVENAPQHVANYLISLAGSFNAYYANTTILDKNDDLSAYKIRLTRAFLKVLTEGLWLLGIKVPNKM